MNIEANTDGKRVSPAQVRSGKIEDPGFGWSRAVFDGNNHGREAWRQPPHAEDEELLFHEPGRILPSVHEGAGGTDCRSHSFKIIKPRFANYVLIVQHGGGIERVDLGYSRRTVNAFAQMDSDTRFRLMWSILDVHTNAKREAAEATAKTFREAFVQGRLKKRHLPARGTTRVWIEPDRAGIG
ncbi:hypothetical protein [Rhodoblastus acidophilus]|uniref:hypothetical protein n=1 Tax=Rhodoblastus acidophilus TaxID=1074 RepID=UPI002225541E|nr:hypothetical protein [Rhodoblastus acidophilus]